MQLGTEECYEATRALHKFLLPYNDRPPARPSGFNKDGRLVTTKMRMRKDKVAVYTLVCWKARYKVSEDEIPANEPVHSPVYAKTTALTHENAELIGQTLADYLETGAEPKTILEMPMYPGYEDVDSLAWHYKWEQELEAKRNESLG